MKSPSTTRCFALVPCAGNGSRSGAKVAKQYALIGARAMVAHTLEALARVPRITGTMVVLSPDDISFDAQVPGFEGWLARCGGETRAQTVANGLAALEAQGANELDWVLVHDAARCLVRPAWIDRLIDACLPDEVGGLLALPVPDTLKQDHQGRVAATLERSGKWAAQTPQMFRLGLLRRALVHAGSSVTDEASAVESLGLAPLLVPGRLENFKVTWPEDFALAARLLATVEPEAHSAAHAR